ncbi:hypothetical protein AN958_04787 [Leucoagaricus sp. SymC.cos]|nr:hypothetical protein AN958_04787 [Leucoagaricus sp. SymC.cos]
MASSYFAPSTPTSDLMTPEYSLWSSGPSRALYHHDAQTDSPYLNNPGTAAAREEAPRHTHTWIHSRPLPLPPIFHLHTAPTSLHASPYGYQHATNPGRPDVATPNSQAMPMFASPPPMQPPNVIPPYAMSMPLADARHPSVSMDGGLSRGIADRRSHSPPLPPTSTNLMYSPYGGATLNPWHHYYYQMNAGSPYSSASYNACLFPSTQTQAAGSGGDALPPYWQRMPHYTITSSGQSTPSRRRYH